MVRKDVGKIHILDPATGERSLFLDIPADEITAGGEQGLLGLAFHPDYAENGRFYVHLGRADGDIGSASTPVPPPTPTSPARGRTTLLTVAHPYTEPQRRLARLRPDDGHLYIGLGDGGGANDPDATARTPGRCSARCCASTSTATTSGNDARNYGIPADNPFVGQRGADEIWAYGLRNPWRMSSIENGDLYIGDVGQKAREEVNFQPAGSPGGANYGWPLAEGTRGDPPPGSTPPSSNTAAATAARSPAAMSTVATGPRCRARIFSPTSPRARSGRWISRTAAPRTRPFALPRSTAPARRSNSSRPSASMGTVSSTPSASPAASSGWT